MTWTHILFIISKLLRLIFVSLVAQLVKNCLRCGRCEFVLWLGKIPLEKGKATHSSILA